MASQHLLEALRGDRLALAQILQDRRSVTTETLPIGARILWNIYLAVLEDALTTLGSLLEFLAARDPAEP